MLVVVKRRYKKVHVVGGAGIFDSITGFFKKLVMSNAAKKLASSALSAGKDAAKEIGKKAIDVAKDTAIIAGKRLVDKMAAKISPTYIDNTTNIDKINTTNNLTQESKAILAKLIGATKSENINNLMMGYGHAIRIQDLVKRLNGGGLKEA